MWLMNRLGISSDQAASGDWWEVDLILALLFAAFVGGAIAIFAM